MREIPLILSIFLLLISSHDALGQRKSSKQKKAEPSIITISGCNMRAIYLPIPEYPSPAIRVGASGRVEVKILIDENGNVESANAISGHPLLRASAEKAALQAKFQPFKLAKKQVKAYAAVVYDFVISFPR